MYKFLKDKSVLYIEDELDVLKNISSLLRNYFGNFYIASDAETGYELFTQHHIDILLVDIELPSMNGIELIKKIRKTHADLPIVIISAYTKTDYLLESIELNLDKYIVKPLTTKKIFQLLSILDNDFSDNNILQLALKVYLDQAAATIEFEQTKNRLTPKELTFLTIIAKKKIITYDEIYALWKDKEPTKNAVRSFMKQLRKKTPHDLIQNNNRIGYFIDTDY